MLYSTIVLVACYVTGSAGAFVGSPAAGRMQQSRVLDVAGSQLQMAERNMLSLKGKVAFVAGVADSSGYGWAICKALAEAGATVTVGTWPPVLGIFEKSLRSGEKSLRHTGIE